MQYSLGLDDLEENMKKMLIYLIFAIVYFTLGIVAAYGKYDNPIFLIVTALTLIADCYVERRLSK